MKKISFIFVILSILIVAIPFSASGVVYAQSTEKVITQYATEEDLNSLMSQIGNDRTAYTEAEKNAGLYFSGLMTALNLSFYGDRNSFIKEFTVAGKKSQNIIGVKTSSTPNAKKIILGAHYDNAYSIKGVTTKSNGVFDNASGLLCLTTLMKILNTKTLPYDIVYIFYGAEENDLNGSKNFVNSLSAVDVKNILICFNFDSIGVGDYTYFFTGDDGNAYGEIFNGSMYGIQKMPLVKRVNILTDFEGYAYTHTGLLSDNTTYLKRGIKCTTFFSGNLVHNGTGYIESTQNDNLIHTENDNIEFIKTKYPNFIKEINKVINLSYDTITNPNFELQISSYSNAINLAFLNNKIVIISIFAVIFIVLCSIKIKTDKE